MRGKPNPSNRRLSAPTTLLDADPGGVVFPGLLLRGVGLREPGLDIDADANVMLVSRPVASMVHDGTVVLVRTLAAVGAAALPGRLRDVAWRPLTMVSLVAALAAPRQGIRRGIRHYFFTPTARVVSHLRRLHGLWPGPTVQTLCSTPADDVALAPLVFADRVVALSEHTRRRLLDEGVLEERVVCIPPAVAPHRG